MPVHSLESVQDFLRQKRIAFVGVSRRAHDFSRNLFRDFLGRGYELIPVHPEAAEIEGLSCVRHVSDIQPPPDAALVLTGYQNAEEVVRDCLKAGVRKIWLYRSLGRGAANSAAVELCLAEGATVIAGECPYMFLPNAGAIHGIHRFFKVLAGTYPK